MTTSGWKNRSRLVRASVLGLAMAFAVGSVPIADAKPGGGSSAGSRGSRTFSAPPATATAPRSAEPMQRTQAPSPGLSNPGMNSAAAAQPRRFGLGTGIMAGLLGAGLLGMLSGHGFFGGLAGLASMLGFVVQIALIMGLVWLAMRFFRSRREPELATAGGPAPAGYGRSNLSGLGGGAGAAPGRPASPDEIGIAPSDYAAFERSLVDIQLAYGREDADSLRRLVAPEMFGYFGQEITDNQRRGVQNRISEPRLHQGDLAESWREGTVDYATVAMRFSVVDVTVERASGRVMGGDPTRPSESTELWTFRRDRGGPWTLSAIQQTR